MLVLLVLLAADDRRAGRPGHRLCTRTDPGLRCRYGRWSGGVIGYDEGTVMTRGMTQGRVRPVADVLALTVHGPAGALDLVVPASAVVTDVAREYAGQSGLPAIPLLYSRTGEVLPASDTLVELGVGTGTILVAATGVHRPTAAGDGSPACSGACVRRLADRGAVVRGRRLARRAGRMVCVGSAGSDHAVALAVLVVAALLGLVPSGSHVTPRVLAAPCFLGAAGFAWAWDPVPERLPWWWA